MNQLWKLRLRAVVRVALGSAAIILLGLPFVAPAPTMARGLTSVSENRSEPLRPPLEYRSANGVLAVTIVAAETRVRLGDRTIDGSTFNGSYAGPILRLKPGDILKMHFINNLPQVTNVHFHGLEVSPQGHGDNSMYMIGPGKTWDYVIPIPKDHPPGVYWFHTHGHDFAEHQVMGGLSGTLVIEGFQDEVPATKPLVERMFALKEFSPSSSGKLNKVPKPVNGMIDTIAGQVDPLVTMQPGETQLWRFSGQTANGYYRMRLAGLKLVEVGRDARPILHPHEVKEVIVGPSERVDVLVTADAAGAYQLVQAGSATGPAGDRFPRQALAEIVVARNPALPEPAPLGPLVVNAPDQKPVPGDRIAAHRLVVFSEDPVTGLFFINHQTFDPMRVDLKVPLGSIEEWTIRNSSQELHVFHIHQLGFEVLSINGKPVPFQGLQDTIDVPIHGEVKIRIPFTNPLMVGRFMFHCHILEHEDKGMMAQIEVFDPKTGPMKDMPGMGAGPHAG